ncbi:MAG: aminotransferase V [Thermoleophilia bacterium]
MEQARAAFPVLQRVAYLNAGTFGPLARETVDAMHDQARRELEQGRSGDPYFRELRQRRAQVRALLAQELGVEPGLVALTASTTNACAIVLAGLDLKADDEVVTTDEEHFGLLGPLHASRARLRIARTRGLPPDQALERIVAEIGPRTRLVALSHVSWLTGQVLPVEAVRQATQVPMVVDGAQSVGAIPVSAAPFDFYAVSCQKWLCGPDGTGGLYVRDPERLRVALPSHWSRVDHAENGSFVPSPGSARFDAVPLSGPALAGLEVALSLAPGWRFHRAQEMAERCRALLAERFSVATPPGQSTLVSFAPGADPAQAATRLYARGVVVRDLPGTPWLRVSCGYWTSEDDLARLLAALQ